MPMAQIGASLPDGKQIGQNRKFKYSLWSFRLKQFDLKERSFTMLAYKMHIHVQFTYQAAILLRDMWNIIRSAFKTNTQRMYDIKFDELMALAQEEWSDWAMLERAASPYHADSRPTEDLLSAVRGAERHLKYLSDRSGFGNKLLKTYESDESGDRNVLKA